MAAWCALGTCPMVKLRPQPTSPRRAAPPVSAARNGPGHVVSPAVRVQARGLPSGFLAGAHWDCGLFNQPINIAHLRKILTNNCFRNVADDLGVSKYMLCFAPVVDERNASIRIHPH